mgnify:FL=1
MIMNQNEEPKLSRLETLELKLEALRNQGPRRQYTHIDDARRKVLVYCEQRNMTLHQFRDRDLQTSKKSFTTFMTHSYDRNQLQSFSMNESYARTISFFAVQKFDKEVEPVRQAIEREREKVAERNQKAEEKAAKKGTKRKAPVNLLP